MAGEQAQSAQTHRVLITLNEEATEAIERLFAELRELGLKSGEIASPLGGVIAGEATTADLSKMRRLPEVKNIEPEPTFTAFG